MKLLLYLIVSIFTVEAIIMGVFQVYLLPAWIEMLADSLLLVLFLFPILRAWVIRPMIVQMNERNELELLLVQEKAEREKAQELERLKNGFVGCVSHELRTPLASIIGFAELLEDEVSGPLNPKQAEFLKQIQRGSERLTHLVDDLLDYARMEAGTFKLTVQAFDFCQMLQEVCGLLQHLATEAHLKLAVTCSPPPLLVTADPRRIEQVLINLIGNAIKYSQEGTIQVRVDREEAHLRCEVKDTGMGISAEDIPKLFQKFSQLAGSEQRGGVGLGLSLCKALIEEHGGTIGVRSEAGKGSTFWFTLPWGAHEGAKGEASTHP